MGNEAVIAEGIGYVFLLIPNRIKELKDAGRAEGLAEALAEVIAEERAEGRAEGFAQGRQEGIKIGERAGYAEERKVVRTLLACHDRGEITLEQLRAVLAEYCNCKND